MKTDFEEKVIHGSFLFPFQYFHSHQNSTVKILVPCHWHENTEILFIENGPLQIIIDGISFTGNTGDIFFFNPERFHQINGTKLDTPKNLIVDDNTETVPFIDFAALKSEADALNKTLGNFETQGVTYDFSDQNNRYIQVDSTGAGYLNLKYSEFGNTDTPLNIKGFTSGNSGSLIINVDCSGAAGSIKVASEIKVYVDGQPVSHSETVDFSTGKVIWNFINTSNSTSIFLQNYFGQIIAPNADVTANNGNGNIIANNVTVSGETHRHDFTGTTIPATVESDVQKTVNGAEPSQNQVFQFTLEQYVGTGGDTADGP